MHTQAFARFSVADPTVGQDRPESFGQVEGRIASLTRVGQASQGEDRDIVGRNHIGRESGTPHLGERCVIKDVGRDAGEARVQRQHRRPRHAVLTSGRSRSLQTGGPQILSPIESVGSQPKPHDRRMVELHNGFDGTFVHGASVCVEQKARCLNGLVDRRGRGLSVKRGGVSASNQLR